MRTFTLPAILLVLFCVFTANSSNAQISNAAPYCTPTYATGTYNGTNDGDFIDGVVFGSISNTSSGAQSGPVYTYYNNMSTVLIPGATETLTVTDSPSWNDHFHPYIDWNGDDDFDDPGENLGDKLITAGGTATWNVMVPLTAAGGTTRMRIVCSFSTVTSGCPSNLSYGETEDYNIIISASPTIDASGVSGAKADLAWEYTPSVSGGKAPYTWSIRERFINGAQNGGWVNIDPATGRLFGTPPASVANDTTAVLIRVTDSESEFDETLVSFFVGDVPGLPFFDSFDTGPLGADYIVNTGGSAFLGLDGTIKAGGSMGLVFSSSSTAGWPLGTATAQVQADIANDPERWSGDMPDMSAYISEWQFVSRATGTKGVRVEFDMKMFSNSSGQYAVNGFFDYSDDFGKTWKPVIFAGSMPNGIIRSSSTNFSHETFDIVLSGDQEFFTFRVRTLINYKYDSAIPTYLGIDNFSVSIPLQHNLEQNLPSAQETAPYEQELTSSGGQLPHTNWQVASGALPNGMSIQTIGGKTYLSAAAYSIPANAAGTYNFDLSVQDGNNDTATKSFVLEVLEEPAPLTIVNQTRIGSAGEGTPYRYILSANGGLAPYEWSLKSSNAPWLNLDTATGALAGTAPADSAGVLVKATINIKDQLGVEYEHTFEFDIVNLLSVQNSQLPDASAGTSYRNRLVVLGGTPPYSYSIAGGSLPDGISLNALTGEFFGAPYRDSAGNYEVDVFIADSGSQQLRTQIQLFVNAPSSNTFSIITANNLPQSFEDVEFNFVLSANGGFPPYVWSAQPGTMPPGLTISTDGKIVGMPVVGSSKTYTIQLTVTDAMNQSSTQSYTLVVGADPTFPTLDTTLTLPTARIGNFYVRNIQVTKGTAPYTFELSDPDALPNGLEATPSGDTVVISGLPKVHARGSTTLSSVGVYAFEVKVTDANNFVDTKTYTVQIEDSLGAPLEVVAVRQSPAGVGEMQNARVGESFGYTLLAIGGSAPYTWALSPAASEVPAGLQLNPFGALSGTPVEGTAGDFVFEVVVTDGAGRSSAKFFTMKVLAADDFTENSQADLAAVGSFNSSKGGGSCALSSKQTSLLWLLAMIPALAWIRRRRA